MFVENNDGAKRSQRSKGQLNFDYSLFFWLLSIIWIELICCNEPCRININLPTRAILHAVWYMFSEIKGNSAHCTILNFSKDTCTNPVKVKKAHDKIELRGGVWWAISIEKVKYTCNIQWISLNQTSVNWTSRSRLRLPGL